MPEKSKQSSFISHWVRIRIEGFALEKLISKAIAKGVEFRNIIYEGETSVLLSVSYEGFRIFKDLARNRYRITLIKEGGSAPAVRHFLKQRVMIAGILVFILFFATQSMFIREVNIVGCQRIDESQVLECARKAGLKKGGFVNFDADKVQQSIYENFDDAVWVKVGVAGGYAEIQIVESQSATQYSREQLDKEKKPCNLVADVDCYIERVYTLRGVSMVETGDFVKKGGILISGKIPLEKTTYGEGEDLNTVLKVHAAGEVTARVPYYYSFYVSKDESREKVDVRVRQWIKENVPKKAQILNKSLNFSEKENIIKVYGVIETRQNVGKEKEIAVSERNANNHNAEH